MSSKSLRVFMLLLLAAGITLAVVFRDQYDAKAMENWVKEAGAAGPVMF